MNNFIKTIDKLLKLKAAWLNTKAAFIREVIKFNEKEFFEQ